MTRRNGDGMARHGPVRVAASVLVCLTEDEVLAFVSGGLGPERLAHINQHVDQCALCFELVRLAVPEDEVEQGPPQFGGLAFRQGSVVAERYRIDRFVARGGM